VGKIILRNKNADNRSFHINISLSSILKKKLPFRVTVVLIFVLATIITASLAVSLQYYFTKQIVTDVTVKQFTHLTKATSDLVQSMDDSATKVTRVLANYPALVKDSQDNTEVRNVFAEIMVNNPTFYAIYLGFENDNFFELINLESSPIVRGQYRALPEDRWVVVKISGEDNDRQRFYDYYDAEFNLRTSVSQASDYYPSLRPWFVSAEEGKINKTEPYLFQNLQAPGQTYSTKIKNSGHVVAIDIALSSYSDFFKTNQIVQNSDVFMYQTDGELIASSRHSQIASLPAPEQMVMTEDEKALIERYPRLKVSNELDWAPIDYAVSGQPRGYSVDFLKMLSAMLGIEFNFMNGFSWGELVELFKSEEISILQPIYKTSNNESLGLFSEPFIKLPYSVVTQPGHPPITHIKQLNGKVVAIPKGWSIIKVVENDYPEISVQQVASTREVMHLVQQGLVDAGLDNTLILGYTAKQYFITELQFHDDIDFAPVAFPYELRLVVSEKHPELLALLNKAIAHFDPEHRALLEAKWLQQEQSMQESTTVPYRELIELGSQPRKYRQLQTVKLDGVAYFAYVTPITTATETSELMAIITPVAEIMGPAMEKVMFTIWVTLGFLLILIPLPWILASPIVTPIKKLEGENEKIKRREYNLVSKPQSSVKEIDELGQSMLEMSESLKQFEEDQEALMDSFIQLIAEAIDDKSPYTAGHCERVPELAFMLAEKAEQVEHGLFEGFRFKSEEEWREFKIAAWLHDCGKITTPEHVVDKGSKLEVIYNRIHEVRTRFEVLLRDAELDYWRQRELTPEREAELKIEWENKRDQIYDDYDFVARMNVGGEFLSDDKLERIKQIANITWQRHLNDRIGLSPLEETRLVGEPPSLPVTETLLQDKPEHLIERFHSTEYAPKLGIDMDIPHYLYNQGELYNLLIARGTLTAEDRFKINEHIIATIKMLENLPFPAELAKVPRYASTHHETMKGTGYPRKLSADELSIPERIMVLSDIYEALTASDRPYKKAKPISVAVDILSKMVDDNHIDREVFELFLTSGVYSDYATRFLPESQLDEVDIEKYLNRAT